MQVSLENSNFKQAVEDLTTCLAKRLKALPEDSRYCFSDIFGSLLSSRFISRSIAETHYQLGVAQAHCEDFVNAEKSLKAAISVLDKRVVNLKKLEVSENIKKELAELDTVLRHQGADERPQGHAEGSVQAGQGLCLCFQK